MTTLQAYPEDPRACIREASRDIERFISLLEGDGLTDGDIATAAHYIRVAARARRIAREQIEAKHAAGALLETNTSL